jgi:mRNA interferase HicA
VPKGELKNFHPREVISVLQRNGFNEIKGGGKGDHRKFFNNSTKKMVIVDWGKKAFSKREMLSFVKQSGINASKWLNS